jgi:hypothetical protein
MMEILYEQNRTIHASVSSFGRTTTYTPLQIMYIYMNAARKCEFCMKSIPLGYLKDRHLGYQFQHCTESTGAEIYFQLPANI